MEGRMPKNNNTKMIVTYLILVFVISSIFYYLIPANGGIESGGGAWVLPLMWTPAVAAFLTCLLNKEKISTLGWGSGKPIYYLIAYFAPIIYAGLTYSVIWVAGLGGVDISIFGSNPIAIIINSLTIGLLPSLFLALGEEIGWRGFLVPRLAQSLSFRNTALLSGVIWGIWHIPVIVIGGYSSGTPTWYAVLCFLFLIIGVSFLFAWLRLKSGSLWPAVFLHAIHNTFIQSILDGITIDYGITKFFTTEFGSGLAMMGLILGTVFWLFGKAQKNDTMST